MNNISTIRYIDEVDLQHKTILLRVDFDVTLNPDHTIADDIRIRCNLPTIQHLLQNHNKIICVAKLGRPKMRDPHLSLAVVVKYLQALLPDQRITLIDDFLTESPQTFQNQTEKDIFVLENIRFYPEEKKNEAEFAKKLASLAQVYVNDAFSMGHRTEASTVGVTKFLPSYGGLHLKKEVTALSSMLENPKHPFVVILGGAKISTKIGVIRKMLTVGDEILLGGGLANTFLKATGVDIKGSLYEEEGIGLVGELMAYAKGVGKELLLPEDYVWGNSVNSQQSTVNSEKTSEAILDIGPKTQEKYAQIIKQAKTIVWNGPMGYAEDPQYSLGTYAMLTAMAENHEGTTLIGGGDTIALIKDKPELSKISHVSTGGGAMLEFIEKGSLPGIEALKSNSMI